MAPDPILLYVLAGLAAGLLSGLFGVGGGIVAVPAAILVGGLSFHDAKAASLVVLILGGGSAAWSHARAGHVLCRLGLVLGSAGAFGAAAGSRLSVLVREDVLAAAFGVLLVLTALRMWFPTPERDAGGHSLPATIAAGVAAGALAGLFGVGGGIVMVPVMTLMGVSIHHAIGTSLVAVLVNGVVAAGVHVALGFGGVMLAVGLPMALAAIAASWAGARWARATPAVRLRKAFAVFLAALGIRFLLWP